MPRRHRARILHHPSEICWRPDPRHDPRLQGHPVWDVPRHSRYCVPMRVHGDGGEVMTNDSMMVISFSGLLARGQTKDVTFLCA
eukprot:7872275-Pyramimonas_sp.AAC.1